MNVGAGLLNFWCRSEVKPRGDEDLSCYIRALVKCQSTLHFFNVDMKECRWKKSVRIFSLIRISKDEEKGVCLAKSWAKENFSCKITFYHVMFVCHFSVVLWLLLGPSVISHLRRRGVKVKSVCGYMKYYFKLHNTTFFIILNIICILNCIWTKCVGQ